MNTLLFGICVAALLSTTSLLVVLLRVSPLLTPVPALLSLLSSVILSVSSVGALLLYGFWHMSHLRNLDTGELLSVSLREGIFLGGATVILLIFHLLNLLNWWIGLSIYAVFLLIELALWETEKEE